MNLRVFFSRFPIPRLIRKLIRDVRDPVPEFPVETMDLQQIGATSREPLVVKEPVLEVCDLDFPEKSEDVEFPKCRLGDFCSFFSKWFTDIIQHLSTVWEQSP